MVFAAPLLRCDIGDRLRERPVVSPGIADGALPLAEREFGRLHQDDSTLIGGPVAQRLHVDHAP
jgi:hypothetical protein